MDTLLIAIIGSGILIIMMEGILWFLFKRRIRGLSFPREVDASFFRFFTVGRLRAIAIMHTVFLVGIVSILSLLLW